MTDEQVFELAEKLGFQDDFGRWNFTSEGLLDFVFMVQEAEQEKPWVKSYGGGKPNYCTPDVDAVNMSQERVDETAKREHEWVGLSVNEARKFYEKYTDREELIYAIDKFLEEKNNG